MRNGLRKTLLLAGLAAGIALPAAADEAANRLAVEHLYAGTLAAGDEQLAAILESDSGNDDARIGLGTIRFVRAIAVAPIRSVPP